MNKIIDMALAEENKAQVIASLRANDFDAAAMALTNLPADNDHCEAVSDFLKNLSAVNKDTATNKVTIIAEIIEQNINQPAHVLDNALHTAFPDASDSAVQSNAAPISSVQENTSNLSLPEIEEKIKEIKTEQAKLIRMNKPLDSEKSKIIKDLQAQKAKMDSVQLSKEEASEKSNETQSGWFNFASSSEIDKIMDYDVCQGTAILQTVKDKLDQQTEEGHIVLSTQVNVKKSQEREFIDMFKGDMPDVTDGDGFVKDVAKKFDTNKKVIGKLLERSEGIQHGGIYQFAGGWLIITREKRENDILPVHKIYPINISPDAFFTIKFNRRYEGGNIYQGAYSILEFKGMNCISFVKSSKGVDIIDSKQLSRFITQAKSFDKSFDVITDTIPAEILTKRPDSTEDEAVDYVINIDKKKTDSTKDNEKVTEEKIDLHKDHPPKAETQQSSSPGQAANPEEKKQNESAPQPAATTSVEQPVASAPIAAPTGEVATKIHNLEVMLEKAKLNNQTSTIKRLEDDIAKLKGSGVISREPAAAPQSSHPMAQQVTAEEHEAIEKVTSDEMNASIASLNIVQQTKDQILSCLTQNFDFDQTTADQAKDLLTEYFGSADYAALLKVRNQIIQEKNNDAVLYFDDYMTIYIELAYIAGNYKKKAEELIVDVRKRSDKVVKEQEEILEKLSKIDNKKKTEAKDLNEKIKLQDRFKDLEDENQNISFDLDKAKLYLEADISEIEKNENNPEHTVYRAENEEVSSKKDQLIHEYKTKLDKVSKKLPQISKKKFAIKGTTISDDEIDRFDLNSISASDLAELATAVGKPIDLADEEKADSVLDITHLVKSFEGHLKSIFYKIEKYKLRIKKHKASLSDTQKEIIKLEKELDSLKIANKVKMTPIIEERRLTEEKLEHLEELS